MSSYSRMFEPSGERDNSTLLRLCAQCKQYGPEHKVVYEPSSKGTYAHTLCSEACVAAFERRAEAR
jgi:hypothetical protein